MPYLAVANRLHTMHNHLRKAFHREEIGIKTDNLHFLPPVYLPVLSAATVRRRDNHIFHAARHHPAQILTGIFQQGEGRIEKEGWNIILQSAHRLGIGETMQHSVS